MSEREGLFRSTAQCDWNEATTRVTIFRDGTEVERLAWPRDFLEGEQAIVEEWAVKQFAPREKMTYRWELPKQGIIFDPHSPWTADLDDLTTGDA